MISSLKVRSVEKAVVIEEPQALSDLALWGRPVRSEERIEMRCVYQAMFIGVTKNLKISIGWNDSWRMCFSFEPV